MTLAEMQRKIESLEKRVRELELQPREVHHHYHDQPATYPVSPTYPQPDFVPVWRPMIDSACCLRGWET